MNCQKKILVIGKIPPPIGGVTIHVKRLLEHFDKYAKEKIEFLDLKKGGKLLFLKNIFKYRLIHLHTSNVHFRFLFSLFCFLTFKKLIITIHGNLGRFNSWKNKFDNFSIFLCFIPIVINQESFLISKNINKRTLLMSAFLPPLQTTPLNSDLLQKITTLRNNYNTVFCTNAYNVSWDKNDDEIYGITQLINIFTKIEHQSLIFSDPSGAYLKYLQKINIIIPNNVLIISYNHDFFEVLKLSDAFIRNTTTDGDSLSIKEALYLNKTVFATDLVNRSSECILYSKNNNDNLQKILNQYSPRTKESIFVESCYPQVHDLYSRLLKANSI